jgi:hypothetical protein
MQVITCRCKSNKDDRAETCTAGYLVLRFVSACGIVRHALESCKTSIIRNNVYDTKRVIKGELSAIDADIQINVEAFD